MIPQSRQQKGAAMIIVVLFFIILSATLVIGISAPISNQIKSTNEFLVSKSSYNIADSQAENAMYRFNKGKTDAPTDLSVLGATATAILTTVGTDKSLVVEGSKSIFDRYVKAVFATGEGVSFNYGLQVGNGGLVMSGSSYITGNVYANGDISGNGGSGWYQTYITGSAIAATLSNPVPSVSISSSTMSTLSTSFGQSDTDQDIAQSFVTATTTAISQVNLYIKKTGNPANTTVKIVNDNSGVPGSTVITSGTLNASTVTTSFAYIPVVMTTAVPLLSMTSYWIVIDNGSNDATNYYSLAAYNNLYSAGATKQGRFGISMANLATTTLDFDLSILVGGDVGTISNMGVGTSGSGDAWANTITNTTIPAVSTLKCQSGTGNSEACNTTFADPVPVAYPISQANIDDWKSDAQAGGSTTTVNMTGSTARSLGPIQINGDLTLGNSSVLTITGPIYVTGNMSINNSSQVKVASALGSASGQIVVDGTVSIGNSGGIAGSGTAGSYVVLTSNKTCTTTADCTANPSVTVTGSAGAVVINAIGGAVKLSNSAGVKAVVAKMMIMSGTAHLTYESGLADVSFTSGPSGSWTKKSWKEVLGW
ncbi:hypothetical protein H7X65_02855 [Candidatus Parcubacteria bacterium]|nr:hypothetical protein [Candidatus Parcubacteria bacterium]